MLKKLFIIFAFALAIIGISKVQAVSFNDSIDIQKSSLDKLIEINEESEWKDLDINKCEYTSEEGIYIYPMENKKGTDNSVKISRNNHSDIAMRIIWNGYGSKEASSYGMTNENDLYVATKIALDCVYSYNNLQDLSTKFRVKEGLDGTEKQRAQKIIEVATNLLNKGYTGEETKSWTIYTDQTFRYEEEREYYYKTFTVRAENADINSINVSTSTDRLQNYFIAEDGTFDRKSSFEAEMGKDSCSFRLVIPKEETVDPFNVDLNINLKYNSFELFTGESSDCTYIVYGNLEQEVNYTVSASDKESTLTVKFVDSETDEPISGAIVQIDGNQCVAYDENGAILRTAGTGQTYIYFSYIPNDYIAPDAPLAVTLEFMDDYEETVKLKHKKGGLSVKTNLTDSTFEIYNSKFEKVGTYQTNEAGEINIDSINTGKYVLRQVGVKDGYKLAEDKIINISYNMTNTIYITNEELPKIEDEENGKQSTENDNKKQQDKEQENKQDDLEKELDKNLEFKKEQKKEGEEDYIVSGKNKSNEEKSNEESKEDNILYTEKASKIVYNSSDDTPKLTVLPRTGNDYFILKVALINIIMLFVFFLKNKKILH